MALGRSLHLCEPPFSSPYNLGNSTPGVEVLCRFTELMCGECGSSDGHVERALRMLLFEGEQVTLESDVWADINGPLLS